MVASFSRAPNGVSRHVFLKMFTKGFSQRSSVLPREEKFRIEERGRMVWNTLPLEIKCCRSSIDETSDSYFDSTKLSKSGCLKNSHSEAFVTPLKASRPKGAKLKTRDFVLNSYYDEAKGSFWMPRRKIEMQRPWRLQSDSLIYPG